MTKNRTTSNFVNKSVKTYSLKKEQFIPITLQQAWDFFSSPLNLAKITPQEMNFVVTSDFKADTKMYEGMLITYTITPVLGIKTRWMTEITHIENGDYFVDEQRFGPYALWHHEHHFKQTDRGILMTDMVHYAIPYGFIGRWANSLFVANKLQQIFDYRGEAIVRIFGE